MHEQISRDPARDYHKPTLAAGAVLLRKDKVAVIHRPRYDDWSLPKGKVDPGETLPTTAAREILEETGFDVQLGSFAARVHYPVGDRTKVVFYWCAEVMDGSFKANDEVDELRWFSPEEARDTLSYEIDRHVLSHALKTPHSKDITRILYVRHARAHQRHNWGGDDNLRPLDKKGRRQAAGLAATLPVFRPQRLYAALPNRCQATITPVAERLGLDISVEEGLGDSGWKRNPEAALRRIKEIASQPGTSVICSQGLAMPGVVHSLTDLPLNEIPMKKGCCWVLSFQNGHLVDWDYQASALPVK